MSEKSIADLQAEFDAAKGWAEKGHVARLITAKRSADDAARRQELMDECEARECDLREKLALSAAQVCGICSYESLVATGHGLVVVRELSADHRPTAVKALTRVDENGAALFSTDPVAVTAALLKCSLYPDSAGDEGRAAIQKLCRDAFPLAHAAYKKACVMAGVLATEAQGKSDG